MSKINIDTVKKANNYVMDFLGQKLSQNYVFHSINHTLDVLKNVEMIGNYYDLKEDEMNILRIAAIFHDVGYVKTYEVHEDESVSIAEKYLKSEGLDNSVVHQITSAIKATKIPQQPKDKLSEILCDADLMYLTYDNYFEQSELLRQEWNLIGLISMTENDFHINSVKFFNSHHYHSEYGIEVLQKKKEKTLKLIKERIID